MPFIPHTDAERAEMLAAVGAASFEDLFRHIPAAVRLKRALRLPKALSEAEVLGLAARAAARNCEPVRAVLFVGAGAYDHFIPAAVDELARRPEFYTAYTPYQPELSQGGLQAIYEYQTMIASLAGMEVANASLYEGATAVYEAALLAVRHTGRKRLLVDGAMNPRYRRALLAYARNLDLEIVEIPHASGASDLDGLAGRADQSVAAAIVQSPNFFGRVADVSALAGKLHAA